MTFFMNNRISSFFRFCIVGILATSIHYGVYWLLMHALNASFAYSLGYAVSFMCNFYLTSIFTFQSKATLKKGLGFGIAHFVNYVLHICFLNLFLFWGLSKTSAPIPVFCIVIPINFILVSYVYKRK